MLRANSEKQAISFEQLYYKIYESLYLIDEAMGTYSFLVECYLLDNKNILAIIIQEGKLYKQFFTVEDSELYVGDLEEIPLEDDNPPMTYQFKVLQDKNGRYRWLAISATTALNRNGNLNSKQLYDSFILHINETGEYPVLNFYHEPNTRLGVADFAARDDNLYILSGVFDDNKFGEAAANTIASMPGYWGQSIEFWYDEYELYEKTLEDGVTVTIPVFTSGINDAVSLLPATDGACIGTGVISQNKYGGGITMNKKLKETLKVLLGDDLLADEFEKIADTTNQEINENMIHQSIEDEEVETEEVETEEAELADETEEVETEETELADETEFEPVVEELDASFIPELLSDLVDDQEFNQMIQSKFDNLVSSLVATLDQVHSRVEQLTAEMNQLRQSQQVVEETLQESEVEQRTRWDNDRPNKRVVSYRARNREDTESVEQTFEDKANNTLGKIKIGGLK